MSGSSIDDLLDRPLPDLTLEDTSGRPFRLRSRVAERPLVLFFFVRCGTPVCVREMREFRERAPEFHAAGVDIVGVSPDPVERNRDWSERLRLNFPLLSDAARRVGDALGLVRRIGIAGWNIELFRRTTLLVDRDGVVRAVWGDVKVRGHAQDVLNVAKALAQSTASAPPAAQNG